jgi:cytidyltransferase-like protein
VIGKFYPPHRGHHFLINQARSQVEHLTVIVCDHPDQRISARLRAEWLSEVHPDVRVVITPDDLPNAPGPWAARTLTILAQRPDKVFTSEDYGFDYAKALGSEHVLVDRERANVPISAREILRDPWGLDRFLEPCVHAFFVRRVVLIGVESTGKTTLAEQLAKSLKTEWIPEYGREYSADKRSPWETEDFVKIASEQQRRENLTARTANRYLIADTNGFATGVWHQRYLGARSSAVDAIGRRDQVDLYLLTTPDFAFVQDGTRDGEHIRDEMHAMFEVHLKEQQSPVIRLQGSRERRHEEAVTAILSMGPRMLFAFESTS